MNNENLTKKIQQEPNKKKMREKWWNEDTRIKTETGVPDLLIFLLNANLEENGDWIRFVILNLSQDKEETKIKLLRLFFLTRNYPQGILKKSFPKDVEVWEDLKKRLDEDWKKFREQEGFYQHYQLRQKKTKFRLFFNKYTPNGKKRKKWQEWETLSKASFTYNFHLLGEVICNIISFFSETGKIKRLPINEEVQFKIEFDIGPEKIPDILITSEKDKKERLGIEVVEVSSSSVEVKGKNQMLENLLPDQIEKGVTNSIKKHQEIKPELIESLIKNIEEVKLGGKPDEKDKVFSASWRISRKINNLNYLIEKLKEWIKIKDKKWEKKNFNDVALWTVLSASFSIYLYHADKGGYRAVADLEIQKDFFSWFLLKKIHENLSDIEIKKFDFLIITFLNADYCSENSLLNKHDPFKKVEWEMIKEKSKLLKYISSNDGVKVAIPNLYIPIRGGKIKNLEEDLKEMEERFEKKWDFKINSIVCEEFGLDNYSFYAQDLEENDNN